MSEGDKEEAVNNQKKDRLYEFTLVQFIKRGRRSKIRQMDIVPTKWLNFNKSKGRCTTKFQETSSNEEDNQLLHDLVQSLADPPADWKEYTVDLKGRAKTYEEALEKFERLKVEENVLTQSDVDAPTLQKQMEEDVKRRHLINELNQLKTMASDTTKYLEGDSQTVEKGALKNTYPSISQTALPVHELNTSLRPDDLSKPSTSIEFKRSQGKRSFIQESETSDDSYSDNDQDVETPSKKVSKEERNDSYSNSEFRNQFIEHKVTTETVANIAIPVIDISTLQCHSDFQTAVISELTMMRSEMESIRRRQDDIANFLLDKQVVLETRSTDFRKKYNVDLPINEKEIFINFDNQLKLNKFLKSDVYTELKKYINKNFVISKSYLAMLRAFITKNVATKYTATRKSHDKENPKDQFKPTEFYKCMESVMLSSRNAKNLDTTDKDLTSSLSDVLSNAKSWDKSKK